LNEKDSSPYQYGKIGKKVDGYLIDLNAMKASISAGYSAKTAKE